jgi:dihydrofolate reductase
MSMSIDGRITGPGVSDEQPLGEGGERLHDWMFAGKSENEGRAFQEELFRTTGAVVVGDNPTWHAPVYVVTHRPREPLPKEGGTTYYFVTDGLDSALDQARAAAGEQDISIQGGADVVQQCLNKGIFDEIRLHLVPVLFGEGTMLFENLEVRDRWLTTDKVETSDGVIHVTFRVDR